MSVPYTLNSNGSVRFCSSMAVLDKSAKSSANNSRNSSTKPVYSCMPCFPTASITTAIFNFFFTNKEKRVGLRIDHCLTPEGNKISYRVVYTHTGNN